MPGRDQLRDVDVDRRRRRVADRLDRIPAGHRSGHHARADPVDRLSRLCAPHQRTEATSVFNLVRSVCSSIGVSLALTMFVVTSTQNRAWLVHYISPYSAALRAAQQAGSYDASTQHGLAVIDREIELQAAVAGYNADFPFLAFAALCRVAAAVVHRSHASADRRRSRAIRAADRRVTLTDSRNSVRS